MDYKYRELIKKYSHTLQQSINLHDMNFKKSLKESKIFTVLMLKDIFDGKASFFEELPTRGPDAFLLFITLLKANGLKTVAEKLSHVAVPAYQISNQHGYSYIIYNYKFENTNESEELKRGLTIEASHLDSALQNFFVNNDFKCNLKADELYSELKKFSKMDFPSSVNSCIVIILGFGSKIENSKVIYGSDGKFVWLHDILNLFSDTNCPSLDCKPKIFLLPSFDDSHSDSTEINKLSTGVNDTFLWYFPPLELYKYIKNKQDGKFFGEILAEKIETEALPYGFESVLKSCYKMFITQLNGDNIPLYNPDFKRLGFCRENISFTSGVLKS